MQDLFSKWRTREVRYSEEFKPMFDELSQKGGGSTLKQTRFGKHFGNNYEFYIYAFFLGLYSDEFSPIAEGTKKERFGQPIQFWGNKANVVGRKDFSSIQEYIYAASIAKSDIDFIALDKGEITEEEVVKKLIQTIEAYANGGFTLIKEKLEDNPNYFLQPTSFLNMVLWVNKGKPISG